MIPHHSLKYYYSRIKNASFFELMQRAREVFFTRRLRARFKKEGLFLINPHIDPAIIRGLQLPDCHYAVEDQTIGELMEGAIFTLNGEREEIERFEEKSRFRFFADLPLSGIDIRMVWEPARLQHLTMLLLYAHNHPEAAEINHLRAFVKEAILEWIKKNSFLSGPHYISAMECGLRIPVFFYTMKILDELELMEKQRILLVIYQHAWWVFRRLSLYSSLGNHTVCECVGLVFAGAIFSSGLEGRTWLEKAIALLTQELYHQVLDDGGPVEQSLAYHRFVLDLYWLAANFLEKNELRDCRDWKPRLLLGEEFLKAFQDKDGHLPFIGDGDDGFAIAPGISPQRSFESYLE